MTSNQVIDMKKKDPVLKTKRMRIQPMSDREIEELIRTSDSDELRSAYREMLDGCRRDPEHRIWYAPWKMALKNGPASIGDLCFKGPARDSAVEIGYGILPEFEGNGYMTEAVQAMTRWAFDRSVVFVEAETEPENKASQRILEKCGFIPDGQGKEGPRFVLESPLTNWMAIFMLLGMSLGTSFGALWGNTGTGISLGLCFGLCIGAALDSSAQKERKAQWDQRKSRPQL